VGGGKKVTTEVDQPCVAGCAASAVEGRPLAVPERVPAFAARAGCGRHGRRRGTRWGRWRDCLMPGNRHTCPIDHDLRLQYQGWGSTRLLPDAPTPGSAKTGARSRPELQGAAEAAPLATPAVIAGPSRGADGIHRWTASPKSLLDHLGLRVQAGWLSLHESSPRPGEPSPGSNHVRCPTSKRSATAQPPSRSHQPCGDGLPSRGGVEPHHDRRPSRAGWRRDVTSQ
jgi:hypothetical protein